MDNKESLSNNFNQKNHQDEFILHENPDIVQQIDKIKDRAKILHDDFQKHCDKHWKMWTKREQDRIYDRKFGNVKPELKYGSRSMSWDEARTLCYNEARVKVNTRIQTRHENLDHSSQRMRDTIMVQARERHQSQGMKRQRLDQEVREIHHASIVKEWTPTMILKITRDSVWKRLAEIYHKHRKGMCMQRTNSRTAIFLQAKKTNSGKHMKNTALILIWSSML